MKKLILMSLVFLIIPFLVSSEEGNLPPATDQIWSIFSALDRPDDSDCESLAVALDGVDAQSASDHCADFARMPQETYGYMADDGMFDEGMETTNILNEANWHSIENLTFDNVMGKIVFGEPVDFMSRDFMVFMDTFPDHIQMGENFIKFDASLVDDLRDMGAIVTMKNVSQFVSPTILVDGEIDNDGVVSAMVYDATNDTLTFNAAHFTTFTAVESSSVVSAPEIDEAHARQFTSKHNKNRLRLVVYGHAFKKDVAVKLGSKKPYKIRRNIKDGKDKIEAFFDLDDLRNLGHRKLTVHVTNTEGDTSQTTDYESRIDLENPKDLRTEKYHSVYHKLIDYLTVLSFLVK
ncbi:MAG: hypothetical protein U9Q72_01020 [Patescibacteria group bacterium]|nr:hypothetical protein [Patescibacteria group bacterium]